ncbi:MAG: helix-turn-helix transcriptional regulator [bacterium]|nr:helix-turn-helix transcriptional regulator [bacterium]
MAEGSDGKVRLGEKLRRVRQERKLTQRELAGKDFTAPFISQVEKGLTVPSLRALVILANRLGYAPGYFLEGKAETDRDGVEVLLNIGQGLLVLGEPEEALAHLRDAMRLAHDLGDSRRMAGVRHQMGLVYARGGDRQRAREELEAAREAFRQADDPAGLAAVDFQLGLLHQQGGNLKRAIQAYQQALEALEQVDDPVLAIKVRGNLGAAHFALEEYEQGATLVSEAAGLAEGVADLASLGRDCLRRALALWTGGELERALPESRRASQILEALDLARTGAALQANMGMVAAEQGRWQEAGGHFARSLDLNRGIGDRWGEAQALTELARYHQQRGEPGLAMEQGQKALAIASELESRADQARAHFVLGGVCRHNGAGADALTHLLASVEVYASLDRPRELANCYYELGELLVVQDRKEEALEYFQKSASLLRQNGGQLAESGPGAGPRRGTTLNLVS